MEFVDFVLAGGAACVAGVVALLALWRRRSRFLEELEFPPSKRRKMWRQERHRRSEELVDMLETRRAAGLEPDASEERLAESVQRRREFDE